MKIYDPNTQNIHKKNQIQMVTHISDAQIFKKSFSEKSYFPWLPWQPKAKDDF